MKRQVDIVRRSVHTFRSRNGMAAVQSVLTVAVAAIMLIGVSSFFNSDAGIRGGTQRAISRLFDQESKWADPGDGTGGADPVEVEPVPNPDDGSGTGSGEDEGDSEHGKENGAENYVLQPGVTLTDDVKKKIKKIADAYYKETKKKLTITSGTRTASSQAEAMYGKLVLGDKLSDYKDQASAKAIKKAYDDGKAAKKSKSDIVKDMTAVIDSQIKKATYISKHLKAGAVDVRSKNMSAKEKKAFKKAAKGVASSVILEKKPPHFHLQF